MKNAANRIDTTTLSNPQAALSTHVDIVWDVDFDSKRLKGSVEHTIKVLQDGTATVNLDSSKLDITQCKIDGTEAKFTRAEAHKSLGEKISVDIPADKQASGSSFKLFIEYACDPQASAIQWLDPSATKGGKHPYVFTQCQAIHARSLLPCQDAPGSKVTYTASVTAPEWCTVLMSALADGKEGTTSKFNQPVPTSTYLIALAGGNLASADISDRVRIWAEPEQIKDAAFEFDETEEFLKIAEDLTCPYAWGRYDVLCLPPSFPYGGMENPCLTFATPTLLAGDKSLADVIAHEISHSWTGNLVTNATWEHFWLNEGWTVWLERKITSRYKGDKNVLKLSAEIGWKHLKDDVTLLCNCNHEDFTKLVAPLGDQDPDDAFSGVPYEKGFYTLNYLEGLVGTPRFEAFAKEYVNEYKYKSLTTQDFKEFFEAFATREMGDDAPKLDWDTIFYAPGLPPTPDYSNDLSQSARALAATWIGFAEAGAVSDGGAGGEGIDSWSSQMKCVFLEAMLDSAETKAFPESVLKALDVAYKLSESKNAEIRFRWQKLCLATDVSWIVPHVMTFVKEQGRMKFVRPLYRSLANSSAADEARKVFMDVCMSYHPIARKMIASDLKIDFMK